MYFRISEWFAFDNAEAIQMLLNKTCSHTKAADKQFVMNGSNLNQCWMRELFKTRQDLYRSWLPISSFCQPFGLSRINWATRGDANWVQMAYCTAIMRTKNCQMEPSPHIHEHRFSHGGLETELRSCWQTRRYSCQDRTVYQPISSRSTQTGLPPTTQHQTQDKRNQIDWQQTYTKIYWRQLQILYFYGNILLKL